MVLRNRTKQADFLFRFRSGESVGLLVLAYKLDPKKGEKEYFLESTALRDALEKKIPSYEALYAPAK